MARKKNKKESKKEEEKDSSGLMSSLREETIEGITAVGFILLALILLLAAFGKAGFVGEKVFDFLTLLFGIGYYLLPIILFVLGASFLAQLRENLAIPKMIGSVLFFVSGLGLVSLLFTKGGLIGGLISGPLVKLFDFWVTLFVLLAVIVVSVLIVFDASLKVSFIKNIFDRKEDEEEEELNIDLGEQEESYEDENYEEEVEEDVKIKEPVLPTPPPADKKAGGLIFFSRRSGDTEFTPPPLSLLEKDSGRPEVGDVKANANIIKRTLQNFGIHVEMDEVSIGPSVTRYALKPAEGVKLSKIVALQKDLALALAAHPLRIEAPIPGKSLVGIEIPNTSKTTVGLGSLFRSSEFQNSDKPLTVCLGKGITGQSHFTNLAKMPHALIAGATGSGKSVTIHAIITSLLYRNHPDDLKFIMVDPKRVELTLYNKIPHLLTPVITDAKKAILSLKWAAEEMNRRYDILESCSVRDIQSYHENILKPGLKSNPDDPPENMPYIIIVIDELADIMQAYPRELEAGIVKLAQMSRAVGIHLMLSTQRPSVNVITGLIKANVPARIALQVASQIDSRTILDQPGAEKLLGAGDMLFMSGEMSQPRRIQSAFISENEVKKVVDWLSKKYEDNLPETDIDLEGKNKPNDIFEAVSGISGGDFGDGDDDDMYDEAKQVVLEAGKASTSYIQRKLRVGYARAARLIDMLEERGVVGPADGSKPREVLSSGGGDNYDRNDYNEENDE